MKRSAGRVCWRLRSLHNFSAAPGRVRVLFHSLAFGVLKPLTGEGSAVQRQIEMTADVMGHSLVYVSGSGSS